MKEEEKKAGELYTKFMKKSLEKVREGGECDWRMVWEWKQCDLV